MALFEYDPAGSFGGALNDLAVKRDVRREESREAVREHGEDRDAVTGHELRDKGYYDALAEASTELKRLDRLEAKEGKLSEAARTGLVQALIKRLGEDVLDTRRSIQEVPLDEEDLRAAEGRLQGLDDAIEVLLDYWPESS